jgi:hypothetical protein
MVYMPCIKGCGCCVARGRLFALMIKSDCISTHIQLRVIRVGDESAQVTYRRSC